MKLDHINGNVGGFGYEILRVMSTQDAGGAAIGECLEIAHLLEENNFESWIKEWSRAADRVSAEAKNALDSGRKISARQGFLRASTYYHAAEFFASFEDPRQEQAWRNSRRCFQQAALLMEPHVETVEIPFESAVLPGYFVRGGAGRRPTLLTMGGFDTSSEELYFWIGPAAAQRGWNCLIFEGPGQRGTLHLNPGVTFRPDYEVPIHTVVDYALSRSEIDSDRLALIGYSLGGYLALRGAAFEPRIKACIADTPVVDVGAAFRSSYPATFAKAPAGAIDLAYHTLALRLPLLRWEFDHARWSLGIQYPHEVFTAWDMYKLWGTEDRLKCPLLFLAGEDEIKRYGATQIADTQRYADALKAPITEHIFTREEGASTHCQMGNFARAHEVIFDWLETTLS